MIFAYALGAIAIFYNVEKSIPLFSTLVKCNRTIFCSSFLTCRILFCVFLLFFSGSQP
mgnify:CR=1 FL=1